MMAKMVPCPYCAAPPQSECVTTGGRTRAPHMLRWEAWRNRYRTSEFRIRIKEDDPGLKLTAGEVYIAIQYWLDPGAKVSLLFRESDGWDPECNLYHHQGEFLGFKEDQ